MFEVRQDSFNGPMAKLLELIELRQIEISRVNLAEVTGDFISYVEKLGEEVSPIILSDFVVIAARLLVLKSKILLPSLELTGEEEADIMDLEHRLRLYREFKAGGMHLKALWEGNKQLFARPLLKSLGEQSFFYPSKQVTQDRLRESIENLLHVMAGLIPEKVTVRGTMVTLQDKIIELTKRLQGSANVTLRGRVSKKEKEEVIVLFLAVLHMLANRLADVEQGDMFGDIIVTNQTDLSQRGENEAFAVGEVGSAGDPSASG